MKKKEEKNKYEYFSKVLFYCSIFLVSFIFFNLLISTVLYIFNISITKVNAIVALICSIGLQLFLLIRNKDIDKVLRIISIVVPIIIIVCSIFVSSKLFDYSYDGNYYHKITVGKLASGWNPLYQQVEDYDKENNELINGYKSAVFVNHYAKASEIYGANIVKLTNSVETGKSINIISLVALFMLVVSFLLYEKKEWFLSILLGLVVISCSTIVTQLLTYYVDALSYIYFFLIILSFLMMDKFNLFKNKNNYLLLFIMTMVIGINIKYSLFAFFGLYCLGYYIWYLIRIRKKTIDINFFKRFTVSAIASVIIGAFVVGLSVYPKNFIVKGHPFYPLMGKEPVDIMTENQPAYFDNKMPVEKFLLATFSKSENIGKASGKTATLKVPFTIYPDELEVAGSYDLRMAGNGPLFGGILIFSSIVFIVYLFGLHKKDKKLFYLFTIPVFITLLMILFLSESWWARYFPQLHLVVFFALILLMLKNSKISNGIMYMLIALILFNNSMFAFNSLKNSYNNTNLNSNSYYLFQNTVDKNSCKLAIYAGNEVDSTHFYGALYNFKEKAEGYKYRLLSLDEYLLNQEEYNNVLSGYLRWRCE